MTIKASALVLSNCGTRQQAFDKGKPLFCCSRLISDLVIDL